MESEVFTLMLDTYTKGVAFVAKHDNEVNFVRQGDWFMLAASSLAHADIAKLMGYTEFAKQGNQILVADAGIISPDSKLEDLLLASKTAPDCKVNNISEDLARVHSSVLLLRWYQELWKNDTVLSKIT